MKYDTEQTVKLEKLYKFRNKIRNIWYAVFEHIYAYIYLSIYLSIYLYNVNNRCIISDPVKKTAQEVSFCHVCKIALSVVLFPVMG